MESQCCLSVGQAYKASAPGASACRFDSCAGQGQASAVAPWQQWHASGSTREGGKQAAAVAAGSNCQGHAGMWHRLQQAAGTASAVVKCPAASRKRGRQDCAPAARTKREDRMQERTQPSTQAGRQAGRQARSESSLQPASANCSKQRLPPAGVSIRMAARQQASSKAASSRERAAGASISKR